MKSVEANPSDAERESLQQVEASRQTEWTEHSFLRDLFLGNFRLALIHPYPLAATERPAFTAFYEQFKEFLRTKVDPVQIDTSGDYPDGVIDGLKRLGAFGMKIPREYGGLGLNQFEYTAPQVEHLCPLFRQ